MKCITVRVHGGTNNTVLKNRVPIPTALQPKPGLDIDEPLAACNPDNHPAQPIVVPVSGSPDKIAQAVVGLFDELALVDDAHVGLAVPHYVDLCAWWAEQYASVELTKEDILSATSRTPEHSFAQLRKPSGRLIEQTTHHFGGVDVAWNRFIVEMTRERGELV
jgi:hypothetical protein